MPKVYSDFIWSSVRVLYESGMFNSVDTLMPHLKKTLKEHPARNAIKERCAAEGWNKHAGKQRVEAAHEKTYAQLFAEAGMDERARVDKIVDGIRCVEYAIERVEKIISFKPELTPLEIVERLQDLIEAIPGYKRVACEYIKEANKLVGAYAPTKIESKNKNEKLSEADITQLSEDEIENEMARLDEILSDKKGPK
jgi:hypothetical protein